MASHILEFADKLLDRYTRYYQPATSSAAYYIVEMPRYGDISSGNMTGLQEDTWCSFTQETWAQRGLAHELVHPFVWVRPDISDGFFSLAVEGFPSYLHLPVLAELKGKDFYDNFMRYIESSYLDKRATGKNSRGRAVPQEKPILEVTAADLSEYKDNFVLSDRVLLFFNYLYTGMGPDGFFDFTRDLFSHGEVTEAVFRETIHKYLPSSDGDVSVWLETTDFPDRFRLSK
jgi:hypothetical protein